MAVLLVVQAFTFPGFCSICKSAVKSLIFRMGFRTEKSAKFLSYHIGTRHYHDMCSICLCSSRSYLPPLSEIMRIPVSIAGTTTLFLGQQCSSWYLIFWVLSLSGSAYGWRPTSEVQTSHTPEEPGLRRAGLPNKAHEGQLGHIRLESVGVCFSPLWGIGETP